MTDADLKALAAAAAYDRYDRIVLARDRGLDAMTRQLVAWAGHNWHTMTPTARQAWRDRAYTLQGIYEAELGRTKDGR